MSTRLERRVLAKTAAYTIAPPMDRSGLSFTNRGAIASVTFTLPVANAAVKGWWYEFFVHAGQSVIVAGAASAKIATPGNAAADNVGFQIANKKIGGRILAICDGTQWLCIGIRQGGGFCVNGTELAGDDSVTPGTALASRPVVLDASAAIAGLLVAFGAALTATQTGGNVGSTSDITTTVSGTTQSTFYDLNALTLAANALSANGKGIIFAAWGTLAANANAKDFKFIVGSTVLVTATGLTGSGTTYLFLVIVMRTAAGAQTAVGLLLEGTAIRALTYSAPAFDETAAAVFKVQSQNTAAAAASGTGRGIAALFLN